MVEERRQARGGPLAVEPIFGSNGEPARSTALQMHSSVLFQEISAGCRQLAESCLTCGEFRPYSLSETINRELYDHTWSA